MAAVPHRIKDVLEKPESRRTAKDRRRLEAWNRRSARLQLARLEEGLAHLAEVLEASGWPELYHDPRHPVFSRECRLGRPADCHWYPCCNDVHPDPRRVYDGVARRWSQTA
jgi:hypothetical protein